MIPRDTRTIRRRIAVGWLPAILVFAFGGATAGCSSSSAMPNATIVPPGSASDAPAMGHTMGHAMPSSAEVVAMTAAMPGYARADGRTQEAYAFAIARPDVTDWMPCYCGCVAMDHRNNTDCYLKPRMAGETATFDEHASYCGICVDIALAAKSMLGDGKSLTEIRSTIDARFGDAAPGTKTPLPPG